MERNRRGGGLLVFQPEILRLFVHGDHVVALVEDGLDDVVGGLAAQVLVRKEDVPHFGLLIVCVYAPVTRLRDDFVVVWWVLLLVECRVIYSAVSQVVIYFGG